MWDGQVHGIQKPSGPSKRHSSPLHALGYVAGQNIVYDIRYAEGDPTRLPVLIDELISLKPDVLAGIEPIVRVMLSKTSTIPIVMLNSADPSLPDWSEAFRIRAET